MKKLFIALILLLGCFNPFAHPAAAASRSSDIPVITFEGKVDEDGINGLIKAIETVNKDNPKSILLVLDTPGGGSDQATTAIRAIQMSKAPIDCVADGEADSAGFYMLQSCRTRGATEGSTLLFHEAYYPTFSQVNVNERMFREFLRSLEVFNTAMIEVCSHRMGIDPVETKKRLDREDWWMTANEGLKEHAVDYVASDLGAVLKSLAATGSPSPASEP